jgi:hypothetical protein
MKFQAFVGGEAFLPTSQTTYILETKRLSQMDNIR